MTEINTYDGREEKPRVDSDPGVADGSELSPESRPDALTAEQLDPAGVDTEQFRKELLEEQQLIGADVVKVIGDVEGLALDKYSKLVALKNLSGSTQNHRELEGVIEVLSELDSIKDAVTTEELEQEALSKSLERIEQIRDLFTVEQQTPREQVADTGGQTAESAIDIAEQIESSLGELKHWENVVTTASGLNPDESDSAVQDRLDSLQEIQAAIKSIEQNLEQAGSDVELQTLASQQITTLMQQFRESKSEIIAEIKDELDQKTGFSAGRLISNIFKGSLAGGAAGAGVGLFGGPGGAFAGGLIGSAVGGVAGASFTTTRWIGDRFRNSEVKELQQFCDSFYT